jgi:hypothetical protein
LVGTWVHAEGASEDGGGEAEHSAGVRFHGLSLPALSYFRPRSNDGPLRKACTLHGVNVHGSLWVLLELHRLKTCSTVQLCQWLHDWVNVYKARLPSAELEQVRRSLGCQ